MDQYVAGGRRMPVIVTSLEEQRRLAGISEARKPDIEGAVTMAFYALRELSERLGDDPFFNRGGKGYEAIQALRPYLLPGVYP